MDSINSLTESVRNLCKILVLKEIVSADTLQESDGNRLYRVQFITLPNKGIYETIILDKPANTNNSYEFKTEKFCIKSRNDISRIDAYGEQPHCVANFANNPIFVLDLRKFCYCINQKKLENRFKGRRFFG